MLERELERSQGVGLELDETIYAVEAVCDKRKAAGMVPERSK